MLTAGALLRAYYAALDAPRLEDLDRLLAADCDWRFPGSRLVGAAQVRASMERNLALGLRMDHRIGHLVDDGAVALCELEATNTIPDATFVVSGAVVCETADGRIVRLAAYPDAEQMRAFFEGLRSRALALKAAGWS